MDKAGLNRRLAGERPFSEEQVTVICKALAIRTEDIPYYFASTFIIDAEEG